MRPAARLRLALLALVALGAGCGPTPAQAGGAVLLVTPLVLAVTTGLQWVLLRLWNDARAGIRLRPHPNLVIAAAFLPPALACLGITRVLEWSGMALWLYGTSYAAVVLLTTRLWLAGPWWERALFGPHLIALPIFILPAIPMALDLVGQLVENQLEPLWIFPGWGGMVTGPLWLLLLAEAIWRRWRVRKAAA